MSLGDRSESRWRDPNHTDSYALIDVAYSGATAQQKAIEVRAASSNTSTESFGPTLINGQAGWKWIFRKSGSERVDYFVRGCGLIFAVLGSASPSRFQALAPMFSRFVESVSCTPGFKPPHAPRGDVPSTQDVTPPPDAVGDSYIGCVTPEDTANCVPPDPGGDTTTFCDSHQCIDNFDNGNGDIVQCNDGQWSQSGGIQGACSHHDGESGYP